MDTNSTQMQDNAKRDIVHVLIALLQFQALLFVAQPLPSSLSIRWLLSGPSLRFLSRPSASPAPCLTSSSQPLTWTAVDNQGSKFFNACIPNWPSLGEFFLRCDVPFFSWRLALFIQVPHLLFHLPPDHGGVEDEDAGGDNAGEEVGVDVDDVSPACSAVNHGPFPPALLPAWSWCPWQPRSCCWECCRGSHRRGRWTLNLPRSWSHTGRGPRSSSDPSSYQFPCRMK